MRFPRHWWVLLICLQLQIPALAGRSCETKPSTPKAITMGMELAYKSLQVLEASGAQVALIARVGQDLSAYGVRYSHMGFVLRDHPKGRWLVIHELNACDTAESSLYDEGLGNFFLDDLFAYETKIVIPRAEEQVKLAALLVSNRASQLHSPRYNMLSYAFSTRYQNSNQWLLEVLAASNSVPEGREQAQAWLQREGYQPDTIKLPTVTRLGARMFRANVAFDDHPFARRMSGLIDTVTVDSVLRFVKRRDPEVREIVLNLP
jgi:hypothetical protein